MHGLSDFLVVECLLLWELADTAMNGLVEGDMSLKQIAEDSSCQENEPSKN